MFLVECTPEDRNKRIHLNSGGDRTNRSDDSIHEIENKLAIFHKRTLPLIEFYRKKGVLISTVPMAIDTKTDDIILKLNSLKHFV